MKIISGRLDRGFELHQDAYERKALEVLRSGRYILGDELAFFEQEFAAHMGALHCVGVASGLDALTLSVRALNLGAGDEVIVPANTYIASVMAVTINGAKPVFVEPDQFYNIDTKKIESSLTSKTRAIMVVHLYGQACKMDDIMDIAKRHGLSVIEDCAQSHDAMFQGKKTGTFGTVGCFSFYPTKNLGAFGDGGAIITQDPAIAERVRQLRNYGSREKYLFEEVGMNSRLDELQAGLLRVRLSHIDELTKERQQIAAFYTEHIKNPRISLPQVREGSSCVWHQYVVLSQERDSLAGYLSENEITTLIHYPVPPHLSKAYEYLGLVEGSLPITEQYAKSVLSLPIYNGITRQELNYVVEAINHFEQ